MPVRAGTVAIGTMELYTAFRAKSIAFAKNRKLFSGVPVGIMRPF